MPASDGKTKESNDKQQKQAPKTVKAAPPTSTSVMAGGGFSLAGAIDQPNQATPEMILQLQEAAGNKAVSRLIASAGTPSDSDASGSDAAASGSAGASGGVGGSSGSSGSSGGGSSSSGGGSKRGSRGGSIQFKLTVGAAGDKYEQEADQVAERVLRMPIQRAPAMEEDEAGVQRQMVQRFNSISVMQRKDMAQPDDPMGSFDVGGDVEQKISSSAGSGNPLPSGTRSFMEPRFGADFGNVRVHTGNESNTLNRQLSAQAFTRGSDIYFGEGKYNPGTTGGNRLLAHELTHVVQQGGAGMAQAKRSPAQRKMQAPVVTLPVNRKEAIQRFLTAESRRAFTTAASANSKYEHGKKLTDLYATPVKEQEAGAPAPWQTEVSVELDTQNVTTDEQDTINDTGRTHSWKFWKKSDEQEKKLKDFARAFMLWDFASRTNQLRPEDTAKYGNASGPEKAKKRKAYMKHASPFQEKYKGLVALGPTAPETQAFLQQEGFLSSMGIDDAQKEKVKAIGPRIDVRSTFIGGPILGINLRAHLFIVYTGRDGKQFYFRGGPGSNYNAGDPINSDTGFTTADYGEYTAGTVDYDPSAPSVTVLEGDAAETKFDAMVAGARAVNAAMVPYRAQIDGKYVKRMKPGMFKEVIGGLFGSKGENCNRAAWTILDYAGVPKNKPMGKHPGWGAPIGADTIGKANAVPKPKADDEGAAKKMKLDKFREVMNDEGMVQVYHDRLMTQKADVLAIDTVVDLLADEIEYRKIKYNDTKIGYIARLQKSKTQTARAKLKVALMAHNWLTTEELKKFEDEVAAKNYVRLVALSLEAGLDRDMDSLSVAAQAIYSLHADLGTPADVRFVKIISQMSDSEVRMLKVNIPAFQALMADVGVKTKFALQIINDRIKEADRKDKVLSAITTSPLPIEVSMWVNHWPDYDNVKEIAKDSAEDVDYVIDVLDTLRPQEVQGEFFHEVLEKLIKKDVELEVYEELAALDPGQDDYINGLATKLGVPREFIGNRFKEVVKQLRSQLEAEAERKRKKKEQKALLAGPSLTLYAFSKMKSPTTGGYEPVVERQLPFALAATIKTDYVDADWTAIYAGKGESFWVKTVEMTEFLKGPKAVKKTGYEPSDYPMGKHKWPYKQNREFQVSATEDGPFNITFIVDVAHSAWIVVLDEMTTKSGRGRLSTNGKTYYIDLAQVFGPPKSGAKVDDEDVEVDDEHEDEREPVKKDDAPLGGILHASEDNIVALQDHSADTIEEYNSPTLIIIIDELWPDRVGPYDFVMVKNPTTNKFGAIYADKLKALYKPHGEVIPDTDLEEEVDDDVEDVAPPTDHLQIAKEEFEKLKVFFKENEGFSLVTLNEMAGWIDGSLHLALKKGLEGREERAETLDDVLGDGTTPASLMLTLYGNR